jgi:hypothetical protein
VDDICGSGVIDSPSVPGGVPRGCLWRFTEAATDLPHGHVRSIFFIVFFFFIARPPVDTLNLTGGCRRRACRGRVTERVRARVLSWFAWSLWVVWWPMQCLFGSGMGAASVTFSSVFVCTFAYHSHLSTALIYAHPHTACLFVKF